jgi:hypothetical protein
MTESNSIVVFQDLVLRGPDEDREKLRQALIEQTSIPWSHDEAAEKDLASKAGREIFGFGVRAC